MIDHKELEKRLNGRQKEVFQLWMAKPTTRFLISMIPESNKSEALETLLQEAFNMGFDSGGSLMMVELAKVVMGEKT